MILSSARRYKTGKQNMAVNCRICKAQDVDYPTDKQMRLIALLCLKLRRPEPTGIDTKGEAGRLIRLLLNTARWHDEKQRT
jgi:hypothetical protein